MPLLITKITVLVSTQCRKLTWHASSSNNNCHPNKQNRPRSASFIAVPTKDSASWDSGITSGTSTSTNNKNHQSAHDSTNNRNHHSGLYQDRSLPTMPLPITYFTGVYTQSISGWTTSESRNNENYQRTPDTIIDCILHLFIALVARYDSRVSPLNLY